MQGQFVLANLIVYWRILSCLDLLQYNQKEILLYPKLFMYNWRPVYLNKQDKPAKTTDTYTDTRNDTIKDSKIDQIICQRWSNCSQRPWQISFKHLTKPTSNFCNLPSYRHVIVLKSGRCFQKFGKLRIKAQYTFF